MRRWAENRLSRLRQSKNRTPFSLACLLPCRYLSTFKNLFSADVKREKNWFYFQYCSIRRSLKNIYRHNSISKGRFFLRPACKLQHAATCLKYLPSHMKTNNRAQGLYESLLVAQSASVIVIGLVNVTASIVLGNLLCCEKRFCWRARSLLSSVSCLCKFDLTNYNCWRAVPLERCGRRPQLDSVWR